jgi:hypothetical protein
VRCGSGWCEMASMAGPIASVAGCGGVSPIAHTRARVRPSASTPRKMNGLAPTVAALRSVGSARRGALTVTCAKKKNGGKSAKGVKARPGR